MDGGWIGDGTTLTRHGEPTSRRSLDRRPNLAARSCAAQVLAKDARATYARVSLAHDFAALSVSRIIASRKAMAYGAVERISFNSARGIEPESSGIDRA